MAAASLEEKLPSLLNIVHVHNEPRVILINFLVLRTGGLSIMERVMTLDPISWPKYRTEYYVKDSRVDNTGSCNYKKRKKGNVTQTV